MIHILGVALAMVYGGFLIFSVYRIKAQVETWLQVLNYIVGGLMLLTFVQPGLGIVGEILALLVTLINGQIIFFRINWIHFGMRTIVTVVLIMLLLF